MAILLALLPDAGHDQLWLLLAAARIGPHSDPYGPLVLESNPPLALWLSALIVALARALHLSLTVTFKLAITLLTAASALACWKLQRLHPISADRALLEPLASSCNPNFFTSSFWRSQNPRSCSSDLRYTYRKSATVFAFLLIAGVIPARDFGQRDHILIFLVLPYLLLAARRISTIPTALPLRITLTLVAALGLALKPHQAFIPIAVELTVWLASKPRHPRLLEPTLLLASAAAYLLAVRQLAPRYFTDVLPLMRDTYWAFGTLALPALQSASIELHLLLIASVLWFLLRPAQRSPLILVLLAAGLGADLAYLAQGTGWYYQQLPALSFFTLALALQLSQTTWYAHLAPPPLPLRTTLPATLALTLLALALTLHFSAFHLDPTQPFPASLQQPQPIPDPAFFRNLPPGTPVATLTTSVDDSVPPAFRYHLTLAQRYPHLWLLPAILRNESGPPPQRRIAPDRLRQLDLLQHRFMVEDLLRWHPTMILIERCQDPAVHCQVLEDRHDNLLAFFLRDPAFARIFAHYHFAQSSGPYDAYLLN